MGVRGEVLGKPAPWTAQAEVEAHQQLVLTRSAAIHVLTLNIRRQVQVCLSHSRSQMSLSDCGHLIVQHSSVGWCAAASEEILNPLDSS